MQKDFDADRSEIRKAVACTIGWRGLTRAGEEVAFNRSESEKLYENAPTVRRQVLNFAGNPRILCRRHKRLIDYARQNSTLTGAIKNSDVPGVMCSGQWNQNYWPRTSKLENLRKLSVDLIYLWRVFCELSGLISLTTDKTYCETTNTILQPWEVKA